MCFNLPNPIGASKNNSNARAEILLSSLSAALAAMPPRPSSSPSAWSILFQHLLVEMAQERDRLLAAAQTQQDPERRASELHKAQSLASDHWDRLLASADCQAHWLAQADVTACGGRLSSSCRQRLFQLEAYCIMPNHMHVVVTPSCAGDGQYHSLAEITQAIKGSSAYEANRVLGRRGQFWRRESYDHVVEGCPTNWCVNPYCPAGSRQGQFG